MIIKKRECIDSSIDELTYKWSRMEWNEMEENGITYRSNSYLME